LSPFFKTVSQVLCHSDGKSSGRPPSLRKRPLLPGVLFLGAGEEAVARRDGRPGAAERDFFVDNLLIRIHFIIVMI
jgi:hypothetical protein